MLYMYDEDDLHKLRVALSDLYFERTRIELEALNTSDGEEYSDEDIEALYEIEDSITNIQSSIQDMVGDEIDGFE